MILAGLEELLPFLEDETNPPALGGDVNTLSAALSFPAEPHHNPVEAGTPIEPTQTDE